MPVPDIELTNDERKLFQAISFEGVHGDHKAAIANGEAAAALTKSLLNRGGVPEVRRKYFTDPAYRAGRLKGSWRHLFHRNGNSDEEMIRHFGFLQHLQYFVCGPDLPQSAIEAFRREVERCGNVTSSDVVPLGKFARQETRTRGLQPHEACEEYFKLALDCRVWVSDAHAIRKAVKSMR
ncbi:MAG: hypothetical protein WB764_22800 [Xanthobacteraceae bacterium]